MWKGYGSRGEEPNGKKLYGKKAGGVVVENFLLGGGGDGQGEEFFDVAADIGNARPGPVRAEENFVGNFLDAREIFHELLGRNAGDVHVHIFVPSNKEERFLHPERPTAVGKDEDEVGIVDGDIVGEERLSVEIASTGKNGSAGVNHDGKLNALSGFVHGGERAEAVAVGVGSEELMGGVDLEAADPEFFDAFDFGGRIGDGARMDRAEGEETFGISGAVFGDPVVDGGSETNDFGADVVDEPGAFDAGAIEKFEKFGGIGRIFGDFVVIAAAFFDEGERFRAKLIEGLDVDVNVDDGLQG
jgi:hypothetical protein